MIRPGGADLFVHSQLRRMRYLPILMVLSVLVLSSCQSDTSTPSTDRDALETYMGRAPGVPLVLPTTLPAEYVFLGPGYQQSVNGAMFVRTLDFRLKDSATSQVVEICVASPGSKASTCVPPDAPETAIHRAVGQYPVWIRPLGVDKFEDGERKFWVEVPLSIDLDSISWLT